MRIPKVFRRRAPSVLFTLPYHAHRIMAETILSFRQETADGNDYDARGHKCPARDGTTVCRPVSVRDFATLLDSATYPFTDTPQSAPVFDRSLPCADLGIGQNPPMGKRKARRRHKPRLHMPTRRVKAGTRGSVKSRRNSRCLPRYLTPRHDYSSDTTRSQYVNPGPHGERPPQHYTHAPQPNTGSSDFHAPVHPPAPKQKVARFGPRIFHYSRCTGRKKAVCVRVSGNSLLYLWVKLDALESCIHLDWNQLYRVEQGFGWLCERRP